MKKNLPGLVIGLLTVIIVIGILIFAAKQPSTDTSTTQTEKVGSQEINFSLPDTNNTTYTLNSFKGKMPVFVEFFAVWCPHCQNESSIINALNAKYAQNMQFFDIQASPYGKDYESGSTATATIDDLKWFKSNFHVNFPILQDPNTTYASKYGVQGFPTIFIIDKTGKISYTSDGEVSQSTLDGAIQKVI